MDIGTTPGGGSEAVQIKAGAARLDGDLVLPAGARGAVVFAHGSGSGRYSPRNRQVASELNRLGLGTLLIDLLTQKEESMDAQTRHLRFNIELLSERLIAAVDWLTSREVSPALAIGCYGASTGAAAALVAAARRPETVRAVVSRGGRVDLAEDHLKDVRAPTLLIVGGMDYPILDLNASVYSLLHCDKRLEVVPGATHLFEEAGALEEVSRLAGDWFERFLG